MTLRLTMVRSGRCRGIAKSLVGAVALLGGLLALLGPASAPADAAFPAPPQVLGWGFYNPDAMAVAGVAGSFLAEVVAAALSPFSDIAPVAKSTLRRGCTSIGRCSALASSS
jgi:hypothetical protein